MTNDPARQKVDLAKLQRKVIGIDTSNMPDQSHIAIKIKNIYACEKEVKGCPITKDGNCIGVITDVSEEWIGGRIWTRYFNLIPELMNMNGKINSIGFEAVDMSKQ